MLRPRYPHPPLCQPQSTHRTAVHSMAEFTGCWGPSSCRSQPLYGALVDAWVRGGAAQHASRHKGDSTNGEGCPQQLQHTRRHMHEVVSPALPPKSCCARWLQGGDAARHCFDRARRRAPARTNVHKAAVVLDALHGAARRLLLLVLLGHLWCLAAHLTGTSQGTVNLTCNQSEHTYEMACKHEARCCPYAMRARIQAAPS